MGFNLQVNSTDWSDGHMTRRCLQTYPSDKENIGVSTCTLNLADRIRENRIDVVGIQEVGKAYDAFVERLGPNYTSSYSGRSGIVWREETAGKGVQVTLVKKPSQIHSNLRSVDIVHFESNGILFLSVWLGHESSRKAAIERIAAYIPDPIMQKTRRVIIAMDSNDVPTKLKREHIQFNRFTLKVPDVNNNFYTCCEDSKYTYEGDYIFDSDKMGKSSFYGIPMDLRDKGMTQLMSDHLPILLETII